MDFLFSEIGITGMLLMILILFFLLGFIKGLVKTGMALLTIVLSSYAAWWGYNHGESLLSDYIANLPSYINIICASLAGLVVFCTFYKVFRFIVNPFHGEDKESRSGWNFGLPSALLSLGLSVCFIFFLVNRLRTTNELDHLKEMMTQGMDKVPNRSGMHKLIIDKLSEYKIGQYLLNHDPLWESNRGKLAKLAVIYYQSEPDSMLENSEVTAILTDPEFVNWIMSQGDVIQALKEQDISALWESDGLDKALESKSLEQKLANLSI